MGHDFLYFCRIGLGILHGMGYFCISIHMTWTTCSRLRETSSFSIKRVLDNVLFVVILSLGAEYVVFWQVSAFLTNVQCDWLQIQSETHRNTI